MVNLSTFVAKVYQGSCNFDTKTITEAYILIHWLNWHFPQRVICELECTPTKSVWAIDDYIVSVTLVL